MQTAIGAYEHLEEAQAAVRSLERQQLSIQDMAIIDERHRLWRKLHPSFDDPAFANLRHRHFFVVVIGGSPYQIDRARALLPRPA